MLLLYRFPHRSLLAATSAAALLCIVSPAAQAQVLFSFSPQDYIVNNTGSVTLKGYIVNDTASTVYLNGFEFSTGSGSGISNSNFFNYVPTSLAPGGTYGSVSSPLSIIDINTNKAASQTYSDALTLNGGTNPTDQAFLASANYTISIAPETNSFVGFGLGILCLAAVTLHYRRRVSLPVAATSTVTVSPLLNSPRNIADAIGLSTSR